MDHSGGPSPISECDPRNDPLTLAADPTGGEGALAPSDEDGAARNVEATLYPDTLSALETALEACGLVADGESVEAGDRERFVKARPNLRVLKRELERKLAGK